MPTKPDSILAPVAVDRWNMVLTGMELDTIFGELESEIGDAVPCAVIEAQRRFVRTGFYSIEGLCARDMRTQFALRGLGDLRGMKPDEKGLTATVDRAFPHLMAVGWSGAYASRPQAWKPAWIGSIHARRSLGGEDPRELRRRVRQQRLSGGTAACSASARDFPVLTGSPSRSRSAGG